MRSFIRTSVHLVRNINTLRNFTPQSKTAGLLQTTCRALSAHSNSDKTVKEFVDAQIKENKLVMFSKTTCPFCMMAKEVLSDVGAGTYPIVEVDQRNDGDDIVKYLSELTGARTVPRVFINGKCIGGGSETMALADSGELEKLLQS